MRELEAKNERFIHLIDTLKEQRIIYNMSDFAQLLGKPRSYISEILTGKRKLTDNFVEDISKKIINVNPNYLLNGTKPILFQLSPTASIGSITGGTVNNISSTGDVNIEPHQAELIALREETKSLKEKISLLERIIAEKETIIELLRK